MSDAGMNLDIHTVLGNEIHEEYFDKFTSFATLVLDVPVALVSIVEVENDRQVFKSQVGLEDPWATEMETPLSHSFCQHVASSNSMFCVEDARDNDLVKDNLAITYLGVIAYLGCPIRDISERPIGAFCAISGEPRQWNDKDKEVVIRIADCVTDIIKVKSTQAQVEQEDAERQMSARNSVEALKSEARSLLTTLENLGMMKEAASEDTIVPLVKACEMKAKKIEELASAL